MSRDPLTVAHRAGNSLELLADAAALGVDVVEADLHLCAGQLEVRHLKTAGPLPFLWDRWEVVPAAAPRLVLPALLDAATGVTLMLDLKGRSRLTGSALARALESHGGTLDVLVCSRYWPGLAPLSPLPTVRTVLSARNRMELSRLRRRVRRGDVHGVSVHLSLLDRDVVAELHESVRVVMTWPVDVPSALERATSVGASGITSSSRAILTEVLRRRTSGGASATGA